MCIIIDTNHLSDFCDNTQEDMNPIRVWLGLGGKPRRGKLAYTRGSKFKEEYFGKNAPSAFSTLLITLERAGATKMVLAECVEKTEGTLISAKSDDKHILSLAICSRATILVSDDRLLGTDFKELITNGKIYKNRKHAGLLRDAVCL